MQRELLGLERTLAEQEARLRTLEGRGGSGRALEETALGLSEVGVLVALSLEEREVTLRLADGRLLQFRLVSGTRAYRDGRRIPLEALSVGTPTRVSLPPWNAARHGRREVTSLEVVGRQA